MRLEIEHGCFAYTPKGTPVINDVSFSAQSGDILAILGPNGAGKTTMLRCTMGFLNWKSGKSMLDGEDMRKIPPKRLWQKIAYVPQAKHAAAAYTVEEAILLGRSSRFGPFSKPGREDVMCCDEVIERLNIEKLRGKRCSEISGGELQMVLIARALATKPGILILDEPESNLDFKNQLIVLRTMSELASEGMGCVFNTHFPSHALQRANKALLLGKDGHTLFGKTNDVITEKNIETAFGVKAVIGEIETPGSTLRDVLPISVTNKGGTLENGASDEKRLAVLSIVTNDFANGERINALLHEKSDMLVGRMGMPYARRGAYIINVTLDAPESDIREVMTRLSMLPGTSVKTTYAPDESTIAGENA